MSTKFRLDKFLAENGYSDSREKAKREIIAGWVKINSETVRNPSKNIAGTEEITIERPKGIFVSRGGEKLQYAIKEFNINVKDKIAVDLGASTGGFTDCLLKNGAQKVYAIDVGYGQLDYNLRNDDRVVVWERTNARNLKIEDFDDKINFVSADLSFVSFAKVYDTIKQLFPGIDGVALIKPQFEACNSEHKKGIVTKKENHINILKRVITELLEKGIKIHNLTYSPIKGPKGNIEFLLYFQVEDSNEKQINKVNKLIENVIDNAHNDLNK